MPFPALSIPGLSDAIGGISDLLPFQLPGRMGAKADMGLKAPGFGAKAPGDVIPRIGDIGAAVGAGRKRPRRGARKIIDQPGAFDGGLADALNPLGDPNDSGILFGDYGDY